MPPCILWLITWQDKALPNTKGLIRNAAAFTTPAYAIRNCFSAIHSYQGVQRYTHPEKFSWFHVPEENSNASTSQCSKCAKDSGTVQTFINTTSFQAEWIFNFISQWMQALNLFLNQHIAYLFNNPITCCNSKNVKMPVGMQCLKWDLCSHFLH